MKVDLAPVINLLHRAEHCTIATQSFQAPGYPYATAVQNVVDEIHNPILLISALAEHTKNILADPKVSLSITEPGNWNVQDAPRLTLIGDAVQVQPSEMLRSRYLRYLPPAEQYLELDFMFFRVVPKRIRYIGGVGRMGWLEGEVFQSASSFQLDVEAPLLAEAQAAAPRNIKVLGIDPYGIDYCADGFRDRAAFGDLPFSTEMLLKLSRKLS